MEPLKKVLESTYDLYHRPEFLRLDPLQCVHGFSDRKDIEIAGLIAAVLAYGRAEIIIRNAEAVFDRVSREPYKFAMETTFSEKQATFKGFKHRFNDGNDMAILFESIAVCIRQYGSLEELFTSDPQKEPSQKTRIDHFTGELKKIGKSIVKKVPQSFDYLLPSPSSGSACKRMNMYLRWMVRKEDRIDFGIWIKVSPSTLIIPVDTHIAKLSRQMKFTKRKSADWRMAEEITAGLRKYDSKDPVRFDFSLCRVGMLTFRKEAT